MLRKLILALAVAALPALILAAPAHAAGLYYGHSQAYGWYGDAQVYVSVDTTSNTQQIWKNGRVSCFPAGAGVVVYWCALGSGNGTSELNVGFDALSGYHHWYVRLWVPAVGNCGVTGNANAYGLVECKGALPGRPSRQLPPGLPLVL